MRIVGAASDPVATDIETIAFDDGTTWDRTELLTRAMTPTDGDDTLELLTGASIQGLGGNDVLTGDEAANTLSGNGGNDLLIGLGGDDTYTFGIGDGQDTIQDTLGDNVIELGAGILPEDVRLVRGQPTVILEMTGTGDRIDTGWVPDPAMAIREVRFENGEVWTAQMLVDMALEATEGDDVLFGTDVAETINGLGGDDTLTSLGGPDDLAGGAGVDLLEGGLGDDTYRFNRWAMTRIASRTPAVSVTRSSSGSVFFPADVRVTQSSDGSAIVLSIGNDGDRVRIDDALGDGKIETIRFQDGTAWSVSELLAEVASPLDDFIFGDENGNPMEGGLGDDRLSGREGNDVYRFTSGDGRDIIRDASTSPADALVIAGYTAADIRFTQLGTGSDDLAIQFDGSDDQIIISDGLRTNGRGIETITLEDDGTVFTVPDIFALLVDAQVTDGNDVIFGSDGADDLSGGPGNDPDRRVGRRRHLSLRQRMTATTASTHSVAVTAS